MSNRKISVDEDYLNNLENKLKDIIKNLEIIESNMVPAGSKMGSTKGVEIEPYIQNLIPWLKNIDKRKIAICNGCGLHFIGNQVGQKSCSSVCRNLAWRKETKYEPNRNYQPKGKPKESFEEILKDGFLTFTKPYSKSEKVALDDPRAVSYLETLTPSEKGDDNAKI